MIYQGGGYGPPVRPSGSALAGALSNFTLGITVTGMYIVGYIWLEI